MEKSMAESNECSSSSDSSIYVCASAVRRTTGHSKSCSLEKTSCKLAELKTLSTMGKSKIHIWSDSQQRPLLLRIPT